MRMIVDTKQHRAATASPTRRAGGPVFASGLTLVLSVTGLACDPKVASDVESPCAEDDGECWLAHCATYTGDREACETRKRCFAVELTQLEDGVCNQVRDVCWAFREPDAAYIQDPELSGPSFPTYFGWVWYEGEPAHVRTRDRVVAARKDENRWDPPATPFGLINPDGSLDLDAVPAAQLCPWPDFEDCIDCGPSLECTLYGPAPVSDQLAACQDYGED